MNELPTDLVDELPTDLVEELPRDLVEELPTDLVEELPRDLADQLPTDLADELPTDPKETFAEKEDRAKGKEVLDIPRIPQGEKIKRSTNSEFSNFINMVCRAGHKLRVIDTRV